MKTATSKLWLVLLFLTCSGLSQETPREWRYSLHSGDHLVYTETVHRVTESSSARVEVEVRFTTHVLALGEVAGGVAVGTQRNRTEAKLIAFREGGKDKLATEGPKFQERVSNGPSRWSEANWFSPAGAPRLPWVAVRESNSRLLMGVHEIESLPDGAVKAGDTWASYNPLGFRFRYVGDELVNGQTCHLAQGDVPSIRLRYWFCPASGAIAKLELEGDQLTFAGKVHEVVRLELQNVRHGEQPKDWIASPETRLAALRTALVTPEIKISTDEVAGVLASGDADAQVLALAILRRRGLPLSSDQASRLAKSADARVKRMAVEHSGEAKSESVTCTQKPMEPLRAEIPGTTVRYSRNARTRGEPYLLHVPEDYSPEGPGSPLIIYLSGGPGLAIDGANGAENTIVKTNYLVLYPNAGGRMWWTREQTEKTDALIQEVLDKLNVDRSHVYLVGFSNGGTGAFYYATLWPKRFSAVAALMGAAKCIDEISLSVNKLAGLPVLFVHGDHDPIIPSSCSESAFKDVRKISPNSELHILKGREHDITLGNDEDLTLSFFEKYSRCTVGRPEKQ